MQNDDLKNNSPTDANNVLAAGLSLIQAKEYLNYKTTI